MTNESKGAPRPVDRPGGSSVPLPWLLRRVNQRYRDAIRERLGGRGFETLPPPGYWALMNLARGVTDAGQLMNAMGTSKQAVSKLVDRLVAEGLVERRPNGADRRRTDLFLSESGRRVALVIADAVEETEQILVAEVGRERFAQFVDTLVHLSREGGPSW